MPEPLDITALLLDWNAGDPEALERLIPAAYDELRQLAQAAMWRERPDHTLSATALVHEAYLRLMRQKQVGFENRAHFFGAAAHVMRRVLVDHARSRSTAKRGGEEAARPSLAEEPLRAAAAQCSAEDILALDEALRQLSAIDPRKAQVVEMKFFAGMTTSEISEALSTSIATVERDWKMARAWLIQSMGPARPAR